MPQSPRTHHRLSPIVGPAAVLAIFTLVAIAALAVVGLPARGAETIGTANLALADGTRAGTVTFTNEPDATQTRVKVVLALPPVSASLAAAAVATRQFHGFHIHANDNAVNGIDCIADVRLASNTWFVSADGHLRRDASEVHGNHSGDLPSIYVNRDGKASLEFTIDRVTTGELFGRAVMLHAGADNFANIPVGEAVAQYKPNASDATTATANTGNAGDRVACGAIDVKR